MKKLCRLTLTFLIVQLVIASPVSAQDELSDTDIFRIMYSDFLTIESFGNIRVVIEGEDAEKIQLNSDQLTDFLKLKYKNNFSAIPYKDQTERIGEFFEDDNVASKIGSLIVHVWIVGTDYPIVYHIEIMAGTIVGEWPYRTATLGYGSKDSVPETVKTTITGMVEELAITFFKTRDEL